MYVLNNDVRMGGSVYKHYNAKQSIGPCRTCPDTFAESGLARPAAALPIA